MAATVGGNGHPPWDSAHMPLFLVRLRFGSPAAIPILLAATAVAAVLVALQVAISPLPGFAALLGAGLALGLACRELRDAILAGFLSGYVAYAAGTAALGVWYAVSGAATAETLLGAIITTLAVGMLAGVWSAGAAAVGGVVRRRPHAAHLL